ncbi:MAG: MFS transporter [Eubacteriales bacterium]
MDRSKKGLLAAIYTLQFGYGLTVTMIAPLAALILADFGISTAEGGLLTTFLSVGGLAATLGTLVFGDRYPKLPVYGAGYLLFSAALLCVVGAPSYAVLLALMLAAGLGSKLVDTLANPVLADAFPKDGSKYLNYLHMSIGVGAFAGPVLLAALLSAGLGWRTAFACIGAFCGVLLAAFSPALLRCMRGSAAAARTSRGTPREAAQEAAQDAIPVTGGKAAVALLCAVTFFYQGHQIIVNNWGALYAERALGLSAGAASFATAALWAGIILSRFLCARFARPAWTMRIIFWGNLAGGVLLTAAAPTGNAFLVYAALVCAGLGGGAVIPLAVAKLCAMFPKNSGRVSSLVFLTLVVSPMLFPPLSGRLADVCGFSWAMGLSGLCLLAAAVFSFFAMRAIDR